MSENTANAPLLGQNLSIVYDQLRLAIRYRTEGHHWNAEKMLETASLLVYRAPNNSSIDAIGQDMERIYAEALAIEGTSAEARHENQTEYLEREASRLFTRHMRILRDYMQAVGYYTMMNSSWTFHDPSGGRTSQ